MKINYPVQVSTIHPSIEFYDEVVALIKKSKDYLAGYSWCNNIYDSWLFTNIGYTICIFLYKVENTQNPDDNLLWVISGDLPSMYLDTFNALSTKEVVANYVELVEDWISHAESGEPLDGCYPLEADTSDESIKILKSRIEVLRTSFIPNITDIKFHKVDTA